MAKDIYKNQLKELRELRSARNTELFAKKIKQMAAQINQRFYRLEKSGGSKDTAYLYAQRETGKDKPRYSVNLEKLKNMSIQELFNLGVEINQKLVSKTSTLRGLREVAKKRLEMSTESLDGWNLSQDEKQEYQKFLENGGGTLMNKRYLDSEQIREDWLRYNRQGVTTKEFIYQYKRYKEKTEDWEFDYGKVHRNLNNLVIRKKQKRKRR